MVVSAFVPLQTTYSEIIYPPLKIQDVAYMTEIKDTTLDFPEERCNCFEFVKNRIQSKPRMSDIVPNTKMATGTVAIENFKGIKHVSLVTKIDADGFWVEESNYHHCATGTRFIHYDRYSLVGFWEP